MIISIFKKNSFLLNSSCPDIRPPHCFPPLFNPVLARGRSHGYLLGSPMLPLRNNAGAHSATHCHYHPNSIKISDAYSIFTLIFFFNSAGKAGEEEQQQMDMHHLQRKTIASKGICSLWSCQRHPPLCSELQFLIPPSTNA